MKIKIKEPGFVGHKRREVESRIDDIIVREDLLNPENERVSVFFKGESNSGILELTRPELESLSNSLKSKIGLIKKSKKIM